MKNVLLLTLSIIGLAAFAPQAQADSCYRGTVRYSDRYDRWERPTYHRHRSSSRYYYGAPTYRRYDSPRRYYYSRDYRRPYYVGDSCRSSNRGYYSAPRLSFFVRF